MSDLPPEVQMFRVGKEAFEVRMRKIAEHTMPGQRLRLQSQNQLQDDTAC